MDKQKPNTKPVDKKVWDKPRKYLREQAKTDNTDAVIEVMRVAETGYIEVIRRCRHCGNWFAAALKLNFIVRVNARGCIIGPALAGRPIGVLTCGAIDESSLFLTSNKG
jgi:hypothetical protein